MKTNTHCHTPLLDLFPPLAPYASGFLQVDDIHSLYWEQSGNPDGVPIIMVHGGPGAGAGPVHRRFFDPDYYRIIIFDQRGAGRSTPHAELLHNTTALLVSDMERLREHLGINRWHVFGGSWGSTLSMVYAAAHPNQVISLILRGIFLCEQPEIDWFLHGMGMIFPEAGEQFLSLLSEEEQKDVLGSYYARLTAPDAEARLEAAIRWSLYEGACSSLLPNYETITTEDQKNQALAIARIEAHYFVHEVRSGKNSILNMIDKFRHIPSVIVQGRYDVVCPIRTAHKLHQLWPEAEYCVIPDAGHSALDPPIRSRLIQATENAKTIPK